MTLYKRLMKHPVLYSFLALMCIGSLLIVGPRMQAEALPPPNVLLVIGDDVGWPY